METITYEELGNISFIPDIILDIILEKLNYNIDTNYLLLIKLSDFIKLIEHEVDGDEEIQEYNEFLKKYLNNNGNIFINILSPKSYE